MYTVWFRKSSRSYTNNQCTSFRQPWRIWFFRDTLIVEVLKGLKKVVGAFNMFHYWSPSLIIKYWFMTLNSSTFVKNTTNYHKTIDKYHPPTPPPPQHQYFTAFRSILGLLRCPLQIFRFFLIIFFIYKNRNFII